MSEPKARYDLQIHRGAQRELANVTGEKSGQLRDRLKQLPYYEQPTSAPFAESLEDRPNLFRVRVDRYRAVCHLDKPAIRVVLVGHRESVYDKLGIAKDRAGIGSEN
jgi:mRNA-degrading endonuclease RelE of RelBE toxin-antitoxin system